MAEHMKTSQEELNELLAEYWKLRHQTGMSLLHSHNVGQLTLIQRYIWKRWPTNLVCTSQAREDPQPSNYMYTPDTPVFTNITIVSQQYQVLSLDYYGNNNGNTVYSNLIDY